jgi:chromosome segregation ATPase
MMASMFSIAASHGDHGTATITNRHLIVEITKLRAEVAEGKRTIQNLAKQLSAASADVAKSVQSVAEYGALEAKLNKCSHERNETRSELAQARKEKEELTDVIATMEASMEDRERMHRRQLEASHEQSEALKSLLETVSTQAMELTSSKEMVESKLRASQQHVEGLQKRLSESNETHETLLLDYNRVSVEAAEMSKKISVLGANIQANEQHRKQVEGKSATLAYERNALQRDLNKVNMEYKKISAAKDSLAATAAELSKTIQTQRESMQQKDIEYARLNSKLDMVSNSHNIALLEIEALSSRLRNTLQTMEQREAEAKKTQERLEKELIEHSAKRENLETDLKMTNENLEASRVEVSRLKECLADREERIKEEKEKLAALGCSEKVQLNGVGKIAFTESYF